MPQRQPENIAVLGLSPDGSRLALSLIANNIPAPSHAAASKIILLNLTNGTRQVWNDRLTDRKHYPRITSAAWTQDGQALAFATHICRVTSLSCFWEFRKLVKVGSGLRAGPVLLRRSGMNSPVQEPVISPDGLSVVEVRSGPGTDTSLVRISLATGGQTVLHRWRTPGTFQVGPNEGNFLVIGQQLQGGNWRLAGWVNDAGFHSLDHRPASSTLPPLMKQWPSPAGPSCRQPRMRVIPAPGAQVSEHLVGAGHKHVRVGDVGDALDQVEAADLTRPAVASPP